MRGPSLNNIEMFQKLCGTESLRNVIFVTTHWDVARNSLNQFEARDRQQEYKTDYLGVMISKGARVEEHDNTTDSACKIIRQLINQNTTTLRIQKELVDDNMPLEKTEAGEAVQGQLQQLRAELQREKEEFAEKLNKEHDRKVKKILADEERKRNEQEKKAKEEMEKLKADRELDMQRIRTDHYLRELELKREAKESSDLTKSLSTPSPATRTAPPVDYGALGTAVSALLFSLLHYFSRVHLEPFIYI